MTYWCALYPIPWTGRKSTIPFRSRSRSQVTYFHTSGPSHLQRANRLAGSAHPVCGEAPPGYLGWIEEPSFGQISLILWRLSISWCRRSAARSRGGREQVEEFGGARRNRTADKGFADPCLATWLSRRKQLQSELRFSESLFPRPTAEVHTGSHGREKFAVPRT
jgi:hypothetical protein